MNDFTSTYGNYSVAQALPEERRTFIRKTYLHLAGAVLLFILMEAYLVTSGAGLWVAQTMLGTKYSWLIVLGLFMGVSMLAQWWANSQSSKPLQYLGLGIFVLAEMLLIN
jgi:FtsH-binding integral membrane protein